MDKYNCVCGSYIINNSSSLKKHNDSDKHKKYIAKTHEITATQTEKQSPKKIEDKIYYVSHEQQK